MESHCVQALGSLTATLKGITHMATAFQGLKSTSLLKVGIPLKIWGDD